MNDEVNNIPRVNPESSEESYTRKYARADPEYHGSPSVRQDYEEYCEDKHVKRLSTKSKKREDEDDSSSSSSASSSAIATAAVVVAVVAVIAIAPGAFGPIADVFDPVLGPIIDYVDPSDTSSESGDPDDPSNPGNQLSAEFTSVQPTDVAIRYTISVTNSQPGDSFTVELSNKFTERSESFIGASHRGEQTGLKAGMTYTLTVLCDGKALVSTSVTTERQLPDLFFELIYAECTCYDDGQFHFQAEIRDGDGTWTNFRATLTDSDGAVSEIQITDPDVGQSIQVDDVLRAESAVLRITCIEVSEDGSSQEKQLYSGQYEI